MLDGVDYNCIRFYKYFFLKKFVFIFNKRLENDYYIKKRNIEVVYISGCVFFKISLCCFLWINMLFFLFEWKLL